VDRVDLGAKFSRFFLRFSCWGIGVVRLATKITVF
jgi:hypothetical protein